MKSVVTRFRVAHSSRVLVATSRRDELRGAFWENNHPDAVPLDSCNHGCGWEVPRRLRWLGMTVRARASGFRESR